LLALAAALCKGTGLCKPGVPPGLANAEAKGTLADMPLAGDVASSDVAHID